MKIQTILDQIDLGIMALPEFQRGYVWNREQVRSMMHSLYYRHPIGSLLVWVTQTESAESRGDGHLAPGSVKLILDGQQRITSLYGIILGKPPKFFEGNAKNFTGLHFNPDEEVFAFYAPFKMKDNPLWLDVTELMKRGAGKFIGQMYQNPGVAEKADVYADRINAIHNVKDIDLHIDEVTGADKTVDVVVDIFNRVNTGGTKLSKGDLALAQVCAQWPDAREEMKARLEKWRQAGFHFKLEWLMRCINTILTGEALFSALKGVDTATFQKGLKNAEKAVDTILNMISGRLGLDHDRVLGSRYSFPLLARYLVQKGWHLKDSGEQDSLLYWYVHTFLWGRYAGSTESTLNKDLAAIEEKDGGLERLLDQMRESRGDLRLRPEDFGGSTKGARFYPMLYLMARVCKARDWGNGLPLNEAMLGKLSSLQIHHIFPKKVLYEHGYSKQDVNAIANFTFLTQETNLHFGGRAPEDYFSECIEKQPGALESHWIPMEPELWKVEDYLEFLAARRQLLAEAANDFLDSLLEGKMPETVIALAVPEEGEPTIPGGVASEEEETLILECSEWASEQGLPEGELLFELAHPETGAPLAILDLAWPDGMQEGFSQPAALLIDEDPETERIASQAGYLCFTDPESFRSYVRREVLAVEEQEALVGK